MCTRVWFALTCCDTTMMTKCIVNHPTVILHVDEIFLGYAIRYVYVMLSDSNKYERSLLSSSVDPIPSRVTSAMASQGKSACCHVCKHEKSRPNCLSRAISWFGQQCVYSSRHIHALSRKAEAGTRHHHVAVHPECICEEGLFGAFADQQ